MKTQLQVAGVVAVVGFGLVVATSVVYAFLGILNFLLN